MRKTVGWLFAALAVAVTACGGTSGVGGTDLGPQDPGPQDVADVPLDATGDEGPRDAVDAVDATDALDAPDTGPKPFLSARRVTKIEDRIGGDNAYGAIGKSFILENTRARFVIQDKDAAVHLSIYGGNLIDADLARVSGGQDNDQFREIFPVVGWRVSSTETVEVVKDGSDGVEAIVRVTGKDTDTGMIQLLDDAGIDLGVTIATDYILRADVPWVLIRTEVRNGADATILRDQMVGDFLSFGGAQQIFTSEGGFTQTPALVDALVSQGRGIAYGYTVDKGEITVPLVDASGTLAILGQSFMVPPKGGKASFDRFLVVGKDIAEVLRSVHEIRGATPRKVGGKVPMQLEPKPGEFETVGVPDARVTAFPLGKGAPGQGGHALAQAVPSTKDGAWSMWLPAGRYDLVFSAPGRNRVVREVDLTAADVDGVDVIFPKPGVFGLDVQEEDAEGVNLGHIPAKATLYCKEGEEGAEAPWSEIGEGERYGACAVFMAPYGKADQFLAKPGRYKAVVSRGPEYQQYVEEDVLIQVGDTTWLETILHRVVDTRGYLSGDFHQHTLGSIDAAPTHQEKVVENLVEGVEIAAMTDHDNITSYASAIAQLGVPDLITSVVGDEVSVNQVAHLNLFGPEGEVYNDDFTAGDLFPFVGAKLFARKTIPDVLTAMRAVPGVRAVQLNHPRSTGNGYLAYIGYDPTTRRALTSKQPLTLAFDAMEIVNAAESEQLGDVTQFVPSADTGIAKMAAGQPDSVPVMMDWFSMLNQGLHTCAMANSDAHNRNDGVGYGRNFLRLDTDRPDQVSTADIVDAILDQRNVVSNGIFLKVTVDGKERMGHQEVVLLEGEKMTVHLVVSAAPWVDVSRLEVYANGRPLPIKAIGNVLIHDDAADPDEEISTPLPLKDGVSDPIVRLDADLQLYPTRDTWYVFTARGQGSLNPVGDGAPFVVTNPLYVDHDGGGFEAIHQP